MSNVMYNRASPMMKCNKQRPKRIPKERPRCPLDCMEEERRQRYERLKACAPPGFHQVLEKIIRNVALARPLHICLFIADFLDAEIFRRTFDDIVYGCQMKKSLKRQPCPTESCMIIKNFVMCQARKGVDDTQFLRGPIPQGELTEPALDRYREHAGIGDFEMAPELEKSEHFEQEDEPVVFAHDPCVQERDLTIPALDRYRDYAGIGPFDADDVVDECFNPKHQANCTCTFCTLKAERSRPAATEEPKPKKDPCAPQPVLQTLYIEQPVYREPAYDKERLFKEKNIKAYEPFGAVFQQYEHYKDDGLQPPDPFKEHPVDRDNMAESPQESQPDNPEEPSSRQELCEDWTPEQETCEEATPAEQRVSAVEAVEEAAASAEQRASAVEAADEPAEEAATPAEQRPSAVEEAAASAEQRESAVEAAEETAEEAAACAELRKSAVEAAEEAATSDEQRASAAAPAVEQKVSEVKREYSDSLCVSVTEIFAESEEPRQSEVAPRQSETAEQEPAGSTAEEETTHVEQASEAAEQENLEETEAAGEEQPPEAGAEAAEEPAEAATDVVEGEEQQPEGDAEATAEEKPPEGETEAA